MGTATKLGSEASQWRKKRVVAKEVDDKVKTTMKKRNLDRDLFEEQRRSEVSCSSGMNQKVCERKSYQDSKGKVPLSPKAALRAAKIRIRFADTIVKAKDKKQELDKKLIKNNRADAMMRIQKEKQVLVRREREEIARIEAKAARLNLRRKERLALDKYEEEAKSNIEDNLASEKELVKLCGGSSQARIRWLKMFGLSLRMEEPELEEI
ncbi:Transcription factor GTE12 [Cardamine amara subsp. amara]|uniref:Transcription factor GTE12 n=1 Tax=Cardamine amara subsp. amara TaxID=228776 RepID=A0ABD0ZT30_CARAN